MAWRAFVGAFVAMVITTEIRTYSIDEC